MQIRGEVTISAPREAVWEALNAPDVLARCIPGCQQLERQSENAFTVSMLARVGPVKTVFDTRLTTLDRCPPSAYRIVAEGKAPAAGFARGSADVSLEKVGENTVLKYIADVTVGGKLAQLGSRLIDGAAKKLSQEFFRRLAEHVGSEG